MNASDAAIPVFQLGRFERAGQAEKQALGREVDAICRASGFLAIADHGVPQALTEDAWRCAEAFFALPLAVKRGAAPPDASYPYCGGRFVRRRERSVNIGDLMARWTNDRWTSTLHRVVIPQKGAGERRQSFAFFHQPNWSAEIETLPACRALGEAPRYAPVRSGPYLMGKFKSTTA